MGSSEKKRKTYIDFLKIIAIYMVLFNHTARNGFSLFTVRQDSMFYAFYLFNAVFIKVAVPLFLMASGALLLGRDHEIRSVVKRFFRFLTVLIAASFISYLYQCFRLHQLQFSIKEFFVTIYQQPINLAIWYLYVYLAFILMLPILSHMAKSMDDRTYKWMLLMYGLIMFLPIPEFLIWHGEATHYSKFYFFVSTQYAFFSLMGYYIDKKAKITRKKAIILCAAGFIAIVVCCIMTNYRCNLLNAWETDNIDTFFGCIIYMPSIALFYAAKYWFENHQIPDRISKALSIIASGTFGLFLIEDICREETMQVFWKLNDHIPTLIACWVWILTACVLGIVVTLLLKKIPGVSRYI